MKTILTIFLLLSALYNHAQEIPETPEEVVVGEREIGATFPGGDRAIQDYITSNIQYPMDAMENLTEGRVIVLFAIEKDGRVSDVRVRKGVSESLDKEAIRLISEMPNWIPGKREGVVAKTWSQIPINFNLGLDKE